MGACGGEEDEAASQRLMGRFIFRILKWGAVGLAALLAITGSITFYVIIDHYNQLPSDQEIRNLRNVNTQKDLVWVRVKDLPKHVPLAFLAAEQSNYLQDGADYGQCVWATVQLFSERPEMRCKMQLLLYIAKTSLFVLRPPHRPRRDILSEPLMARKMETVLTREEIFELYINKSYFGKHAYGIEEAANIYYEKTANTLSIAQAAMLASLIKAPNNYNPTRYPERARTRRDWTLSEMFKREMISEQDLRTATAEPLTK